MHGRQVEAQVEAVVSAPRSGDEGFDGPPQGAPLLRREGLLGRGEGACATRLDLDEMELVRAARHDVEFVAPCAPVAGDDFETAAAQGLGGGLFAEASRTGVRGFGRVCLGAEGSGRGASFRTGALMVWLDEY